MQNKHQVMNLFNQVKQLGPSTVELRPVTEQEKPVELQQTAEAQERPRADYEEE